MIDITKDEFWDAKYEETSRIERKENKVKQFNNNIASEFKHISSNKYNFNI